MRLPDVLRRNSKHFMQKGKQTLLPVFLIASMLVSSLGILSATAAEETKNTSIYASDDFSGSSMSSEWKASGNAQVSNGVMNGKDGKTFYAYLSEKEDASSWTDYAVEADVTLVETDANGKAIAGVALRSDASSWYGGYIMKLSYADKKVYLYSGKADGSTGLVSLATATLENVELNKNYHLKLAVEGNNLLGYLDGTKVLEYTASTENMTGKSAKKNDAGYPGILVNNGVVTIDNFVVTDASVIYSNIFGSTLSADWKASGNGQVSNGTMNGKSGKTFYAYLSEKEGATSWADYSVETDVTFTAADGNGKAIAGVALRSDSSGWYGGYIMKLSYADKMAYLYSGKADGSNGLISLATVALDNVQLNKAYHLKLSAVGDNLTGYIDGIKVLEYTASTENMEVKLAKQNNAGYPGVLVNNGVVTVDNFSIKIETVTTPEPGPEVPVEPNASYSDTFDNADMNPEWKASGNGQVSNGTMNGKDGKSFYAYLSEKEGASLWTNYSVSADIILAEANSDGKATAGIALRSSENSWYGGYIMKLSYKDQKVYIYSAKADGTDGLVTLAAAPISIALNTTYQLKLVAIGDKIVGYVDGTKSLEYTADTESMAERSAKKNDAGYPGVIVNDGYVAIDNLIVKTETEIAPNPDPTPEPTPDPTPSTPIDPEALFGDGFDETSLAGEWVTTSNGQASGGTLNGKGGKSFYAYLSGKEGASGWKDYSVEADVTITSTDANGKAVTGIAMRSAETSWYGGYILKLSYADQKVYLYSAKDDGTNGLVTLASATTVIELNTTYHLKLHAIGNRLTGYIDGVSMTSYEANDKNLAEKSAKKNDAGYPGVMVNNGTVLIDNFIVYEQEDTIGSNNLNVNNYWFYEDFASEDMPISNGWHTNAVQIYDSGALLTTGQWNLYLTGIEDAMKWADYSVEADVVVRPDLDTVEGTGTPIAAIVARSTGKDTGIEFGIASGANGNYVRLYDRTAGKTLATVKNIVIEEGTTYHLQMIVVGRTVRGYLNNELVIEYTGDIPLKGSIGLRNGATSTIFDNVIVKSVTMVNLSGGNFVSSFTGDTYPVSSLVTILALSFVTIVLCMVYYAMMYKKEKNRRKENGI